MKTFLGILAILFSLNALHAQTTPETSKEVPPALGLPGDNLNLYLVLDLFKQSGSVEEFEKMLNDPDRKINNLDLDNDGNIDYLKVVDYGKGDYHTLVIQDPLGETETQDVAIISIEKKGDEVAHVQIIGDESLYGKNYIIEPQLDNTGSATTAPAPAPTVVNNNYYYNNGPEPYYVNVWGWPCVSFIFGIHYSPWISPWFWGYYPHWWHPWPHVYYNVYYGRCSAFGWRGYYRTHRYINRVYIDDYYHVNRKVSKTVEVNIHRNVYRTNTYDNTNKFIRKDDVYNKPSKGNYHYNNSPGKTPPTPQKGNSNWGGMNNKPPKDVYKGHSSGTQPGAPEPNKGKWGNSGKNNAPQNNPPQNNPYKGQQRPSYNKPNNWQPKSQPSNNNPVRSGSYEKGRSPGGKRK